jgi:predicted AAA+ superfamily ATPase
VKKYIAILEALFIVFRVTPYVRNVARALLKEPKLYFFDTGLVKGDAGARFENLVALALVKHAWGRADYDGVPCELRYLRTKEGREVDFCLVEDGEAVLLLEAKLGEESVAKPLAAFCTRLGVPGIQLVRDLKHERIAGPVRILRAAAYLSGLRV